MKKVVTVALMMISMISFAQEAPSKREAEQLTVEKRTQLHVKQLTLELDLNASQQKEMTKLLTEKAAKREALKTAMEEKKASGTKPTADERFEWKNQMLDEQIATKEKVKKILNKEQFEKWEKRNNHKKMAVRKRVVRSHRDAKQG